MNRHRKILLFAGSFVLLVGALSCGGEEFTLKESGGGGSGGGGGGGSGGGGSQLMELDVPDDTELGELSIEDQVALCDDLKLQFDRGTDQQQMQRINCTLQGYNVTNDGMIADAEERCQVEYDRCIQRGAPGLSEITDCMEFGQPDCVTLGQMRECYQAFGSIFEAAIEADLDASPKDCGEILANEPGPTLAGMVEIDTPEQCLQVVATGNQCQ